MALQATVLLLVVQVTADQLLLLFLLKLVTREALLVLHLAVVAAVLVRLAVLAETKSAARVLLVFPAVLVDLFLFMVLVVVALLLQAAQAALILAAMGNQ
jgi:hypothetical protein